jgi:anti-repressor protein
MSELKVFSNSEFGSIRSLMVNGEPYFVGKDVAEILGYQNASKALADHVDDEDKLNNDSLSSLGQRGGWLINESGLYSLILSSKLPSAKRFKRWVTSEVLPAIRKTGGYIEGQDELSDEQLLAKALLVAQKTIENRNHEIERMRPKEIFADAVETSHTSILIGDLAKILCGNGINIGQKRLFDWMRENGYLIKGNRSDRNMPTQRAMEMKLFEIKERSVLNPDGSIKITKTPKVTGKGQQYFVNKFLANSQK